LKSAARFAPSALLRLTKTTDAPALSDQSGFSTERTTLNFLFSFQFSAVSVFVQHLNFSTSSSVFRFETRSLPALTRSCPRHFAFYVARPTRSIQLFSFQFFLNISTSQRLNFLFSFQFSAVSFFVQLLNFFEHRNRLT
jgi:hypothetical protein